jgi:hypothetical protein
MPPLIVPYHEAMDFGQGYNSYTQSTCLSQAITFSEPTRAAPATIFALMHPLPISRLASSSIERPAQKVTYFACFAKDPSDVIRALSMSAASCIKDGTIGYSETDVQIDMNNVLEFQTFAPV